MIVLCMMTVSGLPVHASCLFSSRSCAATPEAPVRSRLPGHVQDPRHVARRPRGGGSWRLRPHLRQSGGHSARESGARVRRANALLSEHPPGEGVGEERDQRHRGAPGSETGDEREIPDPRHGNRIHSPAQPLHGGQREEERGRGPATARQADTAAWEEPQWLTAAGLHRSLQFLSQTVDFYLFIPAANMKQSFPDLGLHAGYFHTQWPQCDPSIQGVHYTLHLLGHIKIKLFSIHLLFWNESIVFYHGWFHSRT